MCTFGDKPPKPNPSKSKACCASLERIRPSLVTEPHRQSLVTTLPLTQHVAETSTPPSPKQLLHNQAYRKFILRDFLTSPCLRQTHTVIFCLYPYSIWIHSYPSLAPAQCPGQNSAPALHPPSFLRCCLPAPCLFSLH